MQLEQVIGAIDTFYAPSTPAQIRQQTGKSLESFQNTVRNACGIKAQVIITLKLSSFLGIRLECFC